MQQQFMPVSSEVVLKLLLEKQFGIFSYTNHYCNRVKKGCSAVRQVAKIQGATWPFVKLQLPKQKTSCTHLLPSMLFCLYCCSTGSIPATLTTVVCGTSYFFFGDIYIYIKIIELSLFFFTMGTKNGGERPMSVSERMCWSQQLHFKRVLKSLSVQVTLMILKFLTTEIV